MDYYDDDDATFWGESSGRASHDPDRTSQIERVRRRQPERTRTHRIVERERAATPRPGDDGEMLWVEPEVRLTERLGVLRSVDPRVLGIGAIAIAVVLAVPLFSALGGGDDDPSRAVVEQSTTTVPVTTAPAPTTSDVVVVTADVDGEAVNGDVDQSGDDTTESDSGGAADGGGSGRVVALRADPDCANQYTAVAGDYWLLIAERTGASLDDLLAANGASAETLIYPGSTVCLPAGAAAPDSDGGAAAAATAAACATEYQAAAGDYWLRIAEAAGVELDELLEVNDATAASPLYPGSTVCLPAGATTPAPPSSQAATTASPTTAAPTTAAPTTAASTTAAATTAPPTTDPPTTQPDATAPRATEPETTAAPPPPPAPGEIEQIIRDVWPDDLEEQALRIAFRESSYNPAARNYCCHGLFQIHWEAHNSWLAEHGVDEISDLYDARTNAEMAYILYQRSGHWGPWAQTAG